MGGFGLAVQKSPAKDGRRREKWGDSLANRVNEFGTCYALEIT
jgi:hypothetical protein